ncbi:hypothetical protein H7097_01400 [Aeromicrobium sp.]|nr:hypothetical protein [Candidatus Saccharibacteria bacterium]
MIIQTFPVDQQISFTTECRNQIEQNINHSGANSGMIVLAALFVVIAATVNLTLFPKWLIPYTKAAQTVTGNRVNASSLTALLLLVETRGIVFLQQAYNAPASIPAVMATDPLVAIPSNTLRNDNPIVRRVLSAIAIIMIVGLALFITYIVLISRA